MNLNSDKCYSKIRQVKNLIKNKVKKDQNTLIQKVYYQIKKR